MTYTLQSSVAAAVLLEADPDDVFFVRQRQPFPLGSTPTMMLTASESPHDQDEAAMLGSIYFLHQPLTEQSVTTRCSRSALW